MAIIAKNVSGSYVTFLNIVLFPVQQIQLDRYFTPDEINNDLDLQDLIEGGEVVINDGNEDLTPNEAISLVVAVRTVNGQSGDVILDPDDFDDTETTNKFYPEADSLKLAGIQENADATDAVTVEAAGAVMENDTSTALMGFVIDNPTMIAALNTNLSSSAATKEYIDTTIAAQIIGQNNYKGGYNAGTNSPDLQAPLAGVVKLGHVYDITAPGTFTPAGGGSHELETGDTLRAKVDDPSTAADWVVVQSNLTSASIKTRYESNADTNAFTNAEQAKLAGIEPNATEDQTGAEIKSLYEAEPDTNAFTDAEQTKVGWLSVTQAVDLDQIESDTATNNAKVTNATHTGDVTGDTVLTLALNVISNNNLNQITPNLIKGRITAGTGDVEDLTPAQVRTMLNVEDGATNTVFGDEYLETENLAFAQNGVIAFPTLAIQHVIPAGAPTGDYYIELTIDWQVDNANGVALFQFENGVAVPPTTPLTDDYIMGVHNNTDWQPLNRSFKMSHINGVATTFSVWWTKNGGAGNVNIRNRKVKRWRIS